MSAKIEVNGEEYPWLPANLKVVRKGIAERWASQALKEYSQAIYELGCAHERLECWYDGLPKAVQDRLKITITIKVGEVTPAIREFLDKMEEENG